MENVSNKTIMVLLAITLMITVVGTIVSVSKLTQLGDRYGILTGATVDNRTQTGTTTLTLAGTAGIKMDDGTVNFGSGYVKAGHSYAILRSDYTNVYRGDITQGNWTNWINTTEVTDFNMTVSNNGTIFLELNITSETDAHAEAWLCTGDVCTSDDARLQVKAVNHEASSCTASGGIQSAYTDLLTHDSKVDVTLCDEFDYDSSSDEIDILFNATIPKDAGTGAHVLTVTFTGTDSSQ